MIFKDHFKCYLDKSIVNILPLTLARLKHRFSGNHSISFRMNMKFYWQVSRIVNFEKFYYQILWIKCELKSLKDKIKNTAENNQLGFIKTLSLYGLKLDGVSCVFAWEHKEKKRTKNSICHPSQSYSLFDSPLCCWFWLFWLFRFAMKIFGHSWKFRLQFFSICAAFYDLTQLDDKICEIRTCLVEKKIYEESVLIKARLLLFERHKPKQSNLMLRFWETKI